MCAVVGGILHGYDLATPPQPQFQTGTVDVYPGAAHAAHQVAAHLPFGTSLFVSGVGIAFVAASVPLFLGAFGIGFLAC